MNGIQMDWMGFGNIVKWNQLGATDSDESSIKEKDGEHTSMCPHGCNGSS